MARYILFHKPYGVLSQFTPEDGAKSLGEFNLPKDVYPAGRLDKDSEGLLLLTDDGPLIEKLLNPKNEKPKTCGDEEHIGDASPLSEGFGAPPACQYSDQYDQGRHLPEFHAHVEGKNAEKQSVMAQRQLLQARGKAKTMDKTKCKHHTNKTW